MKQYFWIFLTIFIISTSTQAQKVFEVEITQAQTIEIDPGPGIVVCAGSEVVLGGNPTATGGNGQLTYYWEPAEMLDDPTSPNPVARVDSHTRFTLLVVDENGCVKQDYIKIGADLCTGIDEGVEIEEFIVFPNPATEKINIKFANNKLSGEIRLSLFNSFGQLALEEIIESSYLNEPFELAIDHLSPGLYFLQVSQSEYCKFGKIQIY